MLTIKYPLKISKENYLFTISSQTIKYLEVNLTKGVKNLYY